jgi:hypothetical protein
VSLELYQQDALRQDLPQHGLWKGDVATLVDHVPHPDGKETGYILEIFNVLGESIAVVAVPTSTVEPLRSDEIFTVRQWAEAS